MIRMATAADATALARMRYEFRATLGEPLEAESEFVDRCTRWMAARLHEESRWHCWIALDEQGIVGHIWLELIEKVPNPTPEPEEHGYITNFYVLERARGTGVGSALLNVALTWCEAKPVHAVILWPTSRSRSLYRRHGFSIRHDLMERLVAGGSFISDEEPA